jgi:hypothetical protein
MLVISNNPPHLAATKHEVAMAICCPIIEARTHGQPSTIYDPPDGATSGVEVGQDTMSLRTRTIEGDPLGVLCVSRKYYASSRETARHLVGRFDLAHNPPATAR